MMTSNDSATVAGGVVNRESEKDDQSVTLETNRHVRSFQWCEIADNPRFSH